MSKGYPQEGARGAENDFRRRFLLDLLNVRATAGQIRLAIEGFRRRLPVGVAEQYGVRPAVGVA